MKKQTVQNVKNSLKFKADEKEGILSVRVGTKKFNVPVKARMLSGGDYLFLSFPACSELFQIGESGLVPLPKDADPGDAYEVLNPGRRRARKSRGTEMPADLANALKGIPSGYKIGYAADGTPRLVRARQRRKAGAE